MYQPELHASYGEPRSNWLARNVAYNPQAKLRQWLPYKWIVSQADLEMIFSILVNRSFHPLNLANPGSFSSF